MFELSTTWYVSWATAICSFANYPLDPGVCRSVSSTHVVDGGLTIFRLKFLRWMDILWSPGQFDAWRVAHNFQRSIFLPPKCYKIGAVNYLDQSDALSTGLARVDPTTQHAIIKVDNTSVVEQGGNRSSVCHR